ncbi:hypothetical protein BOO71_0011206 [Deinococcus marmoris]|uniref:Uncharacterized protein n=1 Tax=Deinococcus marmoris TaxID=249408 RepID=A0A1U7NUQ0_9DEIO|nr:hypothetical protein BOO71_0011206 [Deinococcus marmoris]
MGACVEHGDIDASAGHAAARAVGRVCFLQSCPTSSPAGSLPI